MLFIWFSDIDECGLNETICGPHSFCENGLGSYRCLCEQGYQESWDGEGCVGKCVSLGVYQSISIDKAFRADADCKLYINNVLWWEAAIQNCATDLDILICHNDYVKYKGSRKYKGDTEQKKTFKNTNLTDKFTTRAPQQIFERSDQNVMGPWFAHAPHFYQDFA